MIYGNDPPSAFYKLRINRIKAAQRAQRAELQPGPGQWVESPADFASVLAQAIGIVRDGEDPALPTDKKKLN